MTAYFYTRIPRGWTDRLEWEMTPVEVRAAREAHRARYARVDLSAPGALFKATRIGETVFSGSAGTLTELHESGADIERIGRTP